MKFEDPMNSEVLISSINVFSKTEKRKGAEDSSIPAIPLFIK